MPAHVSKGFPIKPSHRLNTQVTNAGLANARPALFVLRFPAVLALVQAARRAALGLHVQRLLEYADRSACGPHFLVPTLLLCARVVVDVVFRWRLPSWCTCSAGPPCLATMQRHVTQLFDPTGSHSVLPFFDPATGSRVTVRVSSGRNGTPTPEAVVPTAAAAMETYPMKGSSYSAAACDHAGAGGRPLSTNSAASSTLQRSLAAGADAFGAVCTVGAIPRFSRAAVEARRRISAAAADSTPKPHQLPSFHKPRSDSTAPGVNAPGTPLCSNRKNHNSSGSPAMRLVLDSQSEVSSWGCRPECAQCRPTPSKDARARTDSDTADGTWLQAAAIGGPKPWLTRADGETPCRRRRRRTVTNPPDASSGNSNRAQLVKWGAATPDAKAISAMARCEPAVGAAEGADPASCQQTDTSPANTRLLGLLGAPRLPMYGRRASYHAPEGPAAMQQGAGVARQRKRQSLPF